MCQYYVLGIRRRYLCRLRFDVERQSNGRRMGVERLSSRSCKHRRTKQRSSVTLERMRQRRRRNY